MSVDTHVEIIIIEEMIVKRRNRLCSINRTRGKNDFFFNIVSFDIQIALWDGYLDISKLLKKLAVF